MTAEAKRAGVLRRSRRNAEHAINDHVAWTQEETDYICERDAAGEYLRSAYQCAVDLGRSVAAIDTRRPGRSCSAKALLHNAYARIIASTLGTTIIPKT
jgi:hypothetical protein